MLKNGLIQLEVNSTDEKALAGTLINGRPLKDGATQVMHHLDTIYFGSGQMLLFKYPLQKRKFDQLFASIQKENEGDELTQE